MPWVWSFSSRLSKKRVLIIKKIEDLDQIETEVDEEESEEESDTSYLLPEEKEMLMIKRVSHAIEALPEANQREQIFPLDEGWPAKLGIGL